MPLSRFYKPISKNALAGPLPPVYLDEDGNDQETGVAPQEQDKEVQPPTTLEKIRGLIETNSMRNDEAAQNQLENQRDAQQSQNVNTTLAAFNRGANQMGNFQGQAADSSNVDLTTQQLNKDLESEIDIGQKNLAAENARGQQNLNNEESFDKLGFETEKRPFEMESLQNNAQMGQLNLKLQSEKNDANSEYSAQSRAAIAKLLGQQVPENVTAAQLEGKFGDIMEKIQMKKIRTDERNEERAEDRIYKDRQFGLAQAERRDAREAKRENAREEREFREKALALKKQQVDLGGRLTGDHFKAATFATRMVQAEEILEGLERAGYDRSSMKESLRSKLPNFLQPEKGDKLLQQEQAERNFVNAVLRRESGAAISASEFESAQKQYFPRYGDTPNVLKQKRENRLTAVGGMKSEAGRAYGRTAQVITDLDHSGGAVDLTKSTSPNELTLGDDEDFPK